MHPEPHDRPRRRQLAFGLTGAALFALAVGVAFSGGWQGSASTVREMAYGPGPGQKAVSTATVSVVPKVAKTGTVFVVTAKVSAQGAAVQGFCSLTSLSGPFAQQTNSGPVRGGKCSLKVKIGRPGKTRLRVSFRATNPSGAKTFLRDSKSKPATITVTGKPNLKLAIEGFAVIRSGDAPSAVTPSGGTISDCSATDGFGGRVAVAYTFTGDPVGVQTESSWQISGGAPVPGEIAGTPGPGRNTATVPTDQKSPNGSYSVTLTLRDAPRGTPTGPPLATAQGQVTVACPAPVTE